MDSWPRSRISPAAPPYRRPQRSPSFRLSRRAVVRCTCSNASRRSGSRGPESVNHLRSISSGMMPMTFWTTQLSRYRELSRA